MTLYEKLPAATRERRESGRRAALVSYADIRTTQMYDKRRFNHEDSAVFAVRYVGVYHKPTLFSLAPLR